MLLILVVSEKAKKFQLAVNRLEADLGLILCEKYLAIPKKLVHCIKFSCGPSPPPYFVMKDVSHWLGESLESALIQFKGKLAQYCNVM